MSNLADEQCSPLAKGSPQLTPQEISDLQSKTPEWRLDSPGKHIKRSFKFKNYYETVAFVNAVAWIAHQNDHHPEIIFTFNGCDIIYDTHAVGGLSRNDFICAAKIDCLIS